MRSGLLLSVATLGALGFAAPAVGQAPASPVVPAAEAHKHVGQNVTVEVAVRSTGKTVKGALLFLNSHELYRSNSTVTIVLDPFAQEAFHKAGIPNIETHYFRKLVHVTGKIRHFKSVTDILVESPDQIRIIGNVTDSEQPTAVTPTTATATEKAQPQTTSESNMDVSLVAVALLVFGVGLGLFGASRIMSIRREQIPALAKAEAVAAPPEEPKPIS